MKIVVLTIILNAFLSDSQVGNDSHKIRKHCLTSLPKTTCIRGIEFIPDKDGFQIKKTTTQPTRQVRKYIRHFCRIVRNNSIFTDSLDWKAIRKKIKILSAGLSSITQAQDVTDYVVHKLREVGDYHTFFLTKANAEILNHQNVDNREPLARVIGSNIGYIYVPGFISTSDFISTNFAKNIQSLIKKIDSENAINGWIVDLSENTGGNMYPMIAGLGPLIGNGTLGYFVSPDGKSKYKWYYKDGSCGAGNATTVVKISEPYVVKNSNAKIAVLIGSRTGSSGEMTTISFIGKVQVKLFGEPSAGMTTANQGFRLLDGSCLYLASSFATDRNNKMYRDKIIPDVLVDDQEMSIKAAELWLDE